ncbi:MAG: phosphoribosylanthranilate isomerase [Pseudomonadota bacterium]
MAPIAIKFCGLSRPEDMEAASQAQAAYVGFVFFAKSPRNVSFETARDLARRVSPEQIKVGLVVNPTDEMLTELIAKVPLDMIQLHGSETPERVAEVKALTGLKVMKVVGIASAEDVAKIAQYEQIADQILVDAKMPSTADLPGGNGVAFDWSLIANRAWQRPWMLAGGLNIETVKAAVHATGAQQIDLSSGLEDTPGVKSPAKMLAFAEAVRALA